MNWYKFYFMFYTCFVLGDTSHICQFGSNKTSENLKSGSVCEIGIIKNGWHLVFAIRFLLVLFNDCVKGLYCFVLRVGG